LAHCVQVQGQDNHTKTMKQHTKPKTINAPRPGLCADNLLIT